MGSFRRALDLCQFGLTDVELDTLEATFQSAVDPECVNYIEMADELETVFTIKHLDKAPYLTPAPFTIETEHSKELEPEKEDIIRKCVHRIAETVRTRRMIILNYFEDFDKIHNGSISQSQFRSVLGHLELRVSDEEAELLFEKFEVNVGGIFEVDYNTFCPLVDEYSKVPYVPE